MSIPHKTSYDIVGHRGYPERFPENSLVGLRAAADAGADAIELDVQVSSDGVPMVFHDARLDRTTDRRGQIWEFSAAELSEISCHEPRRFDDQFKPCAISTLAEVCTALHDYKGEVFVELKSESFAKISRENLLTRVKDAIVPIAPHATIISFDIDVLLLAKRYTSIGWVLTRISEQALHQAKDLAPDVLICDVKKMNTSSSLPQGDWSWFLYDIVDPKVAEFWHAKGVRYIETWDLGRLTNTKSH